LGLELTLEEGRLRFIDRATGALLPHLEEQDARAEQAEQASQRAEQAEQARQQAEQRAAAAEAEIARLRSLLERK
jgi:hypothetical protein